MTKAYSYLRFSTPEQAAGDSFKRQTALASAYCAKHGLTLDTEVTYDDLGVSAFRGKNSENGRLAEFLEAVKSGLVPAGSVLLVESLDRMSRQAARRALRVLEAICDEDIKVVTLNDNKEYTREALDSDPMSLIMSLLVFVRANEESVMKSRRLKSAWAGKRELAIKDGTAMTTKAPGWLQSLPGGTWKLIPERAKVVRRIFKEASAGVGAHSIAQALNEDKVPVFGSGTRWHRSYIIKLLDSPAVIGTYVPHIMNHTVDGKRTRNPQNPIDNYFPACVDLMVYQRVRAMRTNTASPLRGTATVLYNIFGGLVRCGRCGTSMTLQNKGVKGGARTLVCTKARYGAGCRYTAVRYPEVESAFIRDAQRILVLTPSGAEDFEGSIERLVDEIDQLETGIEALLDLVKTTGERTCGPKIAEAERELDEKRAELLDIQQRMASTTGPLVDRRIADLKKHLGSPNLDRRQINACIRALFSGLSVNPDSGVATLGWRHGGSTEFVYGFPKEE